VLHLSVVSTFQCWTTESVLQTQRLVLLCPIPGYCNPKISKHESVSSYPGRRCNPCEGGQPSLRLAPCPEHESTAFILFRYFRVAVLAAAPQSRQMPSARAETVQGCLPPASARRKLPPGWRVDRGDALQLVAISSVEKLYSQQNCVGLVLPMILQVFCKFMNGKAPTGPISTPCRSLFLIYRKSGNLTFSPAENRQLKEI